MYTVVGIAFLVVIGLVAVGLRFLHRTIASRHLQDREPLTDDVMYQVFYERSGLTKDSVLEIWHQIARTLKVPAERLRPSDRFGTDVGAFFITSEELDTLAEYDCQRARKLGAQVDFKRIKTVDDFVRALAERV